MHRQQQPIFLSSRQWPFLATGSSSQCLDSDAVGMPLQVDATIEYALQRHKAALSFADLRLDSPYNTYLHAGLPPTPIANPGGLASSCAYARAQQRSLLCLLRPRHARVRDDARAAPSQRRPLPALKRK